MQQFIFRQKTANTDKAIIQKSSPVKSRKFSLIQSRSHSTASGWKHVNGPEVFGEGTSMILKPPSSFDRGFENYPVPLRFRFKRLGRNLTDFTQYSSYWLITDKAKNLLAAISENDFRFLSIDTEVDKGEELKSMWLCDIIPVLDVVDETRSKVSVGESDTGKRIHYITGLSSLAFDESGINSHHAFRLATAPHICICDQTVKTAIKKAGLTGLSFEDALKSD